MHHALVQFLLGQYDFYERKALLAIRSFQDLYRPFDVVKMALSAGISGQHGCHCRGFQQGIAVDLESGNFEAPIESRRCASAPAGAASSTSRQIVTRERIVLGTAIVFHTAPGASVIH
jgi:hypothetical protein